MGVGIKSCGELEDGGDITEDSPPFCPRPCSEAGETEETREGARWGLGAGRGAAGCCDKGSLVNWGSLMRLVWRQSSEEQEPRAACLCGWCSSPACIGGLARGLMEARLLTQLVDPEL